MPPLRERGDDILLLAQTFLKKYALAEKKNFKSFRLGAEKVLLAYKWLGNVRQLLNVIRNMVLLNDGDIITTEMTLAALEEEPSCNSLETTPILSHPPPEPIKETSYLSIAITSGNALRSFKEMEKEILQKSIAYCGGNVEKTAKGLKIGPATIHRKKRQWIN